MLLADPQPAMRPSGAQAASGAYTRQTRAVIGMSESGKRLMHGRRVSWLWGFRRA